MTDSPNSDQDQGEPACAATLSGRLRRNISSWRQQTELSRERNVLRYLDAWEKTHKPPTLRRIAFPYERPVPEPAACQDTALAAFVQLATLRIGVRRAFVTLISRDTEFCLAESTRSMNLQDDFCADPRDKSWLGTCCFARVDGINDLALPAWRQARKDRDIPTDNSVYYTEGISAHYCIYSDVAQNHSVSQLPFVQRGPSLRFYFSVPLRDAEGSAIGSLTMLDDKPRWGINADEMLFVEDLGDTIAQSLQSSIIASQRERSEKLIQALGTFNSGGSSLREWWVGQKRANMNRGGRQRNTDAATSEEYHSKSFDDEFGVADDRPGETATGPQAKTGSLASPMINRRSKSPQSARKGNGKLLDDRPDEHIEVNDFCSTQESRNVNTDHSEKADETNSEKTKRPFESVDQLKGAHNRASNLLRESMGTAGVAFFDARAAAARRPFPRPSASTESTNLSGKPNKSIAKKLSSSEDSKTTTNSDTETSDGTSTRLRYCKLEGSSTQSGPHASSSPSLQLMEQDLARLIRTYPMGKVFAYNESGGVYSGSEESVGSGGSSESAAGSGRSSQRVSTRHSRNARILRKLVGDARSIAFYPIWDDNTEKYRSCVVTWTNHRNRFFDSNEDITYLSAFAHSLQAEIGRIETIASDIAKGKFISSVSHELRSPLHGILAGIEMIQDTQLSPFQEEMALSVALAGRTLLDTVNHILDYSKISSLTREQKKDRAKVDAYRHLSASSKQSQGTDNTANVDLARLTEEVVESCVSAHRFSKSFEQEFKASDTSGHPTETQQDGQLSVTLDIDKRESWTTALSPGTMTRVITNLVGNALKYTHSGAISVKLFTDNGRTDRSGETFVNLQVEDSGIGMSQNFLQKDLWTAFKQADSHFVGTGLGMSIVKELAKELNATLDVSSEIGKGTVIRVRFSIRFLEQVDSGDESLPPPTIKARHLCMLDVATPSETTRPTGVEAVTDSVKRMASQWLSSEISTSQSFTHNEEVTMYAISEHDLSLLDSTRKDAVESLVSRLAAKGTRLLVLGSSAGSCQPVFEFESFAFKPIYIHQPIGPRKLLRVVNGAKDSIITRQPSDFALHNVRLPRTKPKKITGNTPGYGLHDAHERPCYFDLPRRPTNSQDAEASGHLTALPSTLEIPSAEAPQQTPSLAQRTETSPKEPTESSPEQNGDVVLLVEDNKINMRLLIALMKKQGLSYDCAENGLEAVNQYIDDPQRFFLVLMDMSMPVMDGFEATAKIRDFERKQKRQHVSISALTGVTSEEARTNAINAGVDKYLTKPIRMGELRALVTESRQKFRSKNSPQLG